jgi:DNA-binding IclR family transcriptional regulator
MWRSVRKTSSIAVPIGESDAVGSLCVTFAASALTQRQAAVEFLPPLRSAAAEISAALGRLK